jgi:hypothetical protein
MERGEAARLRGKMAEEKVGKVLGQLREEGIIRAFGQTVAFSQEDIKGIDFFIYSGKKEIKIQVKSFQVSNKERAKYRIRGIFLIIVPPTIDELAVRRRILEILKQQKVELNQPFLFSKF